MVSNRSTLVGLPRAQAASHIIEYSQGQYDLLMCVSITGKNAAQILNSVEHTVLEHLPFSTEAIYTLLSEIIETYSKNEQLEFSFLLKNRDIVVSAAYNGMVGLVRNKKVGFLITSNNNLKLISGKWKPNDIYTLATFSAQEVINTVHAKLDQGLDASFIVDSLADSFHTNEQSTKQALILIDFDEKNKKNISENKVIKNPESINNELETITAKKRNQPHIYLPKINFVHILKKIKNNKKIFIILTSIVILVLIFLLIISFIYFNKRNIQVTALEEKLVPLQTQLQIINDDKNKNTFQVKEELTIILQQLQIIKQETENKNYLQKKIDEEIEYASSLFDDTSNKASIDTLTTFVDLSSIKSDFIASDMDVNNRNIVLADSGTDSVLTVDIDSKKSQVIPVEAEQTLKTTSIDGELYILQNNITKLDTNQENALTEIVKADDTVKQASFVAAYDNYLYLLNKSKRNIYRYSRTSIENNTPISWLRTAQGLDFNTITDMAVDGSVWLATSEGTIFNFFQGSEKDFSITQLSPELNSSLKLFTTTTSDNLYILEPAQKRVLIIKKTGEFIKEMKHDTFASATDIIADETSSKVFVLNGSLVVELPI